MTPLVTRIALTFLLIVLCGLLLGLATANRPRWRARAVAIVAAGVVGLVLCGFYLVWTFP